MLTFSASPVLAQERPETKPYVEFSLNSGGLIKPASGPTIGGGIGVGWGTTSTMTLEITQSRFGNYGIGVSDNFRSVYPISNSRAWDFSGNFQFNLRSRTAQTKTIPYVTMGIGLVSSRFITPAVTCCLAPAHLATNSFESSKLTITFGSGLRIPLRKGFGIRPELKLLTVGGESELSSFPPRSRDTLIRLTLGLYMQTR
jgi:hypothetical protein